LRGIAVPEPDRDGRRDRERRDPRDGEEFRREERERREGSGSGRKRGRAGEEGPAERGHGDSKRARRVG